MKLRKPDRIFGVKARTRSQKRFMRHFIIIKSVVYLIIFALALLFILELRKMNI